MGSTRRSDGVDDAFPDEGSLLPGEADELRTRFEKLSARHKKWLSGLVREANEANLSIRVNERPTARRVHIATALFYAIDNRYTDEQLRGLLATVLDDDSVLMATLPLGAALGTCSATQAAQLRELASLGTTLTGGNNE